MVRLVRIVRSYKVLRRKFTRTTAYPSKWSMRKCNFLGFASLWRFHLPLTMLAARMLGEVRAIVWSVGTSFKPLLGAVFLGWTPSSTAKSQNLVWRCYSQVVWLSWAFYFFEVPRLVLVGVMLNCIGQHITRSIWPWQASPGFKIFVKNIGAIQIEMCYWMKSGYFCCFMFAISFRIYLMAVYLVDTCNSYRVAMDSTDPGFQPLGILTWNISCHHHCLHPGRCFMEPENTRRKAENHLPKHHFQVRAVNLLGVYFWLLFWLAFW